MKQLSFFLVLLVLCNPLLLLGESKQVRKRQRPVVPRIIRMSKPLPGQELPIGIRFNIDKGWYIYGEKPGDYGLPTKVSFKVHVGEKSIDTKRVSLEWPEPQVKIHDDGLKSNHYPDTFLLPVRGIFLPKTVKDDELLVLQAQVSWLECSADLCVPGAKSIAIELPLDQWGGLSAS